MNTVPFFPVFPLHNIKVSFVVSERFTIPNRLARLYVAILKHNRKVVKVKRGLRFTTIYLSSRPNRFSNDNPIVIGNIFD